MNATFDREYNSRKYYLEKRTAKSVSLLEVIIILIGNIFAFLKKENVKNIIKVSISLSCLAGLYSIVHLVEAGTLYAFPAIIIALALLAVVAFCFRNEN